MFVSPLDLQASGPRKATTFSLVLLTRHRRQEGLNAVRLAWANTQMNDLIRSGLLYSYREALHYIALLLGRKLEIFHSDHLLVLYLLC